MIGLDDSFSLTRISIDNIDAASLRVRLIAHPDDYMARGIDATFVNITEPANMTDAMVTFSWKHDQHEDLAGTEPFEEVDAGTGHWKIYYPGAMLIPGTVSATITVYQDGRIFNIPLPTITVSEFPIDIDALPSTDTFSMFAAALKVLNEGIENVEETIEEAKDAITKTNEAKDLAGIATQEAKDATAESRVATEQANAATSEAFEAARAAEEATGKAEELIESCTTTVTEAAEAVEQIKAAEAERQEYYEATKASVEAGDFNGATFIPSVSPDGEITWTNDKELPNPEKRNIKGPKGDIGEGLKILGHYDDLDALKADHATGERPGDAYMVGDHYYTWNGSDWEDCGTFQSVKSITTDEIDALFV